MLPESILLHDINPTVQTDLRMHIHRDLVHHAALFKLIRCVKEREMKREGRKRREE